MASIRNYISLQDRMTPVFRSILKSMDSTLRVMRNLDKQANNGVQSKAYRTAERNIKRANNEVIRMTNNLSLADRGAGRLATSTNKVANNMTRMSSGGLNLSNLAAGLYLLKNIASTLTSIMEIPDTGNALQYRFETYDTSEATGSQLYDASYMAAQRSRSELDSTASLASRILVSGATKGSGAEAIKLAELLNKASFIGGSSSAESQRALLQLSQGLSSGVLQGDELRAIREQAPGLTDTLARGLSSLGERGVLPDKFIGTTVGDLKQLGADGELTAERIIAAFKEMSEYIDTTFEGSPKQFGQAITGIVNVWKRWLKIMSQSDNALGKITNKAWELLGWFESDAGTKFFNMLSIGLNLAVDGIFKFIDLIGSIITWFNNLENKTQLLQTALLTLGTVGAGAAVYFVTEWVKAWGTAIGPVLLVIVLVGALIYALLEAGYTAQEITGGISGGFMFLAYSIITAIVWIINIAYWAAALIWDLAVAIALVIIEIVIAVVALIILAVQAIVQIILWALTTIWAVLITIYNVLYTIVAGAFGLIKGVIIGVYGLFVGLGEGILGILYGIASAIDWVFGSNLADTVGGWMEGLGQSVVDLADTLDPLKDFENIGVQWSTSYGSVGDMYAGKGEYDDWNILDNMGDVWEGSEKLIRQFEADAPSMMLDPSALDKWALDNTLNPMDGWNSGFDFGVSAQDKVSGWIDQAKTDLSMSDLTNIEDLMSQMNLDGLSINGGDLDSIGAIKSDVDLSDEDVQLLKDMSAREFLLNMQTVTPTANIKFGDVRETADINKIIEVIQDMVDEELATTLLVD